MKGQMTENGFSLIEVMIAMAIIATSIAALISVINSSTVLQINTEKEIAAKNQARAIIETLKGYTCDQIVTMYSPEAGIGLAGFQEGDDASGVIAVDDSDPTLLDVTVRIKWKTGEAAGQARYRTYEVRRRISDEDNG